MSKDLMRWMNFFFKWGKQGVACAGCSRTHSSAPATPVTPPHHTEVGRAHANWRLEET